MTFIAVFSVFDSAGRATCSAFWGGRIWPVCTGLCDFARKAKIEARTIRPDGIARRSASGFLRGDARESTA